MSERRYGYGAYAALEAFWGGALGAKFVYGSPLGDIAGVVIGAGVGALFAAALRDTWR